MSTSVSKDTNDFLLLLNKIIQRNQDSHVMLSFNLLKTNLAIQKYENPRDSTYMDDVIGQSKEFYEAYGNILNNKDKPEHTDSELYLIDMNKRLHNGERVKAKESNQSSQENSFNNVNEGSTEGPDFEAGGFKSFEIDKIQDSHFSGQFNPIFERKDEHESSQNDNIGSGKQVKNIFNRTESLFENVSENNLNHKDGDAKGGVSTGVQEGKEHIKGEEHDVHVTIKEEEEDDIDIDKTSKEKADAKDNKLKEGNSTNLEPTNNTMEGGNTLLSSITQSKAKEFK